MRILYFAWVRQRVGLGEETAVLPDGVATVSELIDWLKSRHEGYEAAFADLRAIRVAVDHEHVGLDHPLQGANEVAFFPPVTGG
jgi:molybdopterin synthase sulfur carrier subunit